MRAIYSLMRKLKCIKQLDGISAGPINENNLFRWNAIIFWAF